jgi:hypothetical protein
LKVEKSEKRKDYTEDAEFAEKSGEDQELREESSGVLAYALGLKTIFLIDIAYDLP